MVPFFSSNCIPPHRSHCFLILFCFTLFCSCEEELHTQELADQTDVDPLTL